MTTSVRKAAWCIPAVLLCLAVGVKPAGALDTLAWLDPPFPVPQTPYLVEGGGTATLADHKGKAIVLNFWATWCPPCIEEMPSLDRLAARHAGSHLAVITVAMDRASEEKIRAFHDEHELLHLTIQRDPDMKLARSMRLFGLPTTFLIDHRGHVVAQLVGEAQWDGDEALAVIMPLVEAAAADAP